MVKWEYTDKVEVYHMLNVLKALGMIDHQEWYVKHRMLFKV